MISSDISHLKFIGRKLLSVIVVVFSQTISTRLAKNRRTLGGGVEVRRRGGRGTVAPTKRERAGRT